MAEWDADMKKGWNINERHAADPIGSNEPRGKDRSQRKHKLDGPTLTGSEGALRDRLMKQFCQLEGSTNSEAYRNSSCWCAGPCGGAHLRSDNSPFCSRCLAAPCGHCGDVERCEPACEVMYPQEPHKGDTPKTWSDRAWTAMTLGRELSDYYSNQSVDSLAWDWRPAPPPGFDANGSPTE